MKLPKNAPAVIDELGDIERKLKPLGDLKARRDELRAQVLAWTDGLAAEQGAVIDGLRYAVHIAPRRNERNFTSLLKVYKAVGVRNFLAHCSFTLKAAQELLSGEALAKLVTEGRTGPRSVATLPRVVPKEAA